MLNLEGHHKMEWVIICLLNVLCLFSGCDQSKVKTMKVTATAFTSNDVQTTDNEPSIAAWGDELTPGMKCIAVSRDLIELGLTYKTEVTIEGLQGTYRVLDKMNKRWEKKIDIYMGNDREAARQWGRKQVTISWKAEP